MKYLEWNNIISEYFFNAANAGKEIHLYLSRNDIIALGKTFLEGETDDEIWLDYINSIKRGLPGSIGNVIAKAKLAHSKNNLVGLVKEDGTFATIDNVPVLYPPYISYLTFFVMPLIENINNDNLRANNYYGRLNGFLQSQNISEVIGTTDFRDNDINNLWEELSLWANYQNNGDLGLFHVTPFQNPNWIYVGKVFSQCLLPPKFFIRLPELFDLLGLVPNSFLSEKSLLDKIVSVRTDLIPKNTLEFLKKGDELSNSIIQTIQKQYIKWSGETHEEIQFGLITRKKRNYTLAPLFLQFEINTNDETISFSYRMYSSNDYPEDLKFGEFQNLYELNGWSKTIPLAFKETLELKDNFNKWIVKFPHRDVRLFISASSVQLNNDFWIETDRLSVTEGMYLMCKIDKQELIEKWGETFRIGDFKKIDLDGLPNNYALFYLRNPTEGQSDFSILTLYTEKRVELVGGLKLNFRSYSAEYMPEVEIINSNGAEIVYLQYKGAEEKIFLSKKSLINNRWLLPETTEKNVSFYIKLEDENFSGNILLYNLISADNTAIKVVGANLPRRDSFGRSVTKDSEQFCLGSNIVNPNKSSQRYFSSYSFLFTSTIPEVQTTINTVTFNRHNGNCLSDFLSLKSELSSKDFFKAFEFFYSKEFLGPLTNISYNLTKLKRASLNFYDYIGVLDYDYETKKIVLNPPQLIFIPTKTGREVLLIGARDNMLIDRIIMLSTKYKLQVKITRQFSSNDSLLLPDAISIKSFQQQNDSFGEKNIKAFASELNIRFTTDYYPQVALQYFSASIADYENTLQEIDQNDYDWARYVFNIDKLEFEKSDTHSFDKTFTLVKYKLNEYTYEFKLWKEGRCYQVDMNWGRYLVLYHFQKNVILFDGGNFKVAIPIELPLPRLLAESIMLLSGLAPDFKIIGGKEYRIYSNIPSVFASNLFAKLGQNPKKIDL